MLHEKMLLAKALLKNVAYKIVAEKMLLTKMQLKNIAYKNKNVA